MNQEALSAYEAAVHELFIRWDAMRLAVEHMGGRHGQTVSEKEIFLYRKFIELIKVFL